MQQNVVNQGPRSPSRATACLDFLAPHTSDATSTIRQFGPLLIFGQYIPFLGAREIAVRNQAELIDVNEFRRVADPRYRWSGISRSPASGVTIPSATILPFGTKRRDRILPRVGTELHEVAIDADAVEQQIQDRLIAALSDPA